MEKIKTLLIEDSGLMRIMISDALRSDPHIEVVGTAQNGKEGVDKALKLRPQVVITDMLMPGYDGLYAVKNLMDRSPVPIILLSSLGRTDPGIFDALQAGAFDFMDKPKAKDSRQFKNALHELTGKVKAASKLDSAVLGERGNKTNHNAHSFQRVLPYEILAVGASTGGPSAIEVLVKQLPSNLAIPVVIVQHMPARFLESFAQRLNTIVPLPVKLATRNERLQPGTIYITPGDGNVEIKEGAHGGPVIQYNDKIYKEFNHPSVDCMLSSVAHWYGSKAIGVILTGMGRDGREGLMQIKKKGGLTVAQDAASCVVNGMPHAAVEIGAADHVVRLKEIPGFIMSCF